MNIADIGGEFALIKRIVKDINDNDIIKGVGDDCAVIRHKKDAHLLVTTDMLVENDHFNLDWCSSEQVGMKLMESNVSDIFAMGGAPKYAFLSMSIKKETSVEFIEELYKGLYQSAKRHSVLIIGGDTTHGTEYVFNLTLVGEVNPKLLCLRSMAQKDDLICVTGTLGGSAAGLELLRNRKSGYLTDHLEPKTRTGAEAETIAAYANAMIDVSDGLGSEVQHICNESNLGALIFYEKIPLSSTTEESAVKLDKNPYNFALCGGEDFELVFTIPKNKLELLKMSFSDFTIVGEIHEKDKGVYLLKDKKKHKLKKGYDHFD